MDEAPRAAQQQEPLPRTGVMLQRPAIVGLLYLFNMFVGFSVFVGLVLAYVWRGEAETPAWEKTHYTYLIRTFWIGLAMFVGTLVLVIGTIIGVSFSQAVQGESAEPGVALAVFGMIAVWLLGAVWFGVRCVLSLVNASSCRPMPRPGTWLF